MNPSPERAVGEPLHLFHHSFKRGGGMERYALVLAASLRELGCRVVVHAYRTDPVLAQAMGLELQPASVARFPRKLQGFRFFRQVRQLRPQLQGRQIALSRVPVQDAIICGGTHRGFLRRARKLPGPFDWLQVWMEQRAYQSARLVISHSALCTHELDRYYHLPAAKVVTLFPPVDARFQPPADDHARAKARQQLGLPADQAVLLFPSMGHRRKGLKPLCQALQGVEGSFVLAVAGKPPTHRRWPFVRYLGYIEDMTPAYQAADFTVLASYYEPFGLVGPESMLCGTPLLFEQDIGCLAAIRPEHVLTFSVWQPESIRQAVGRALTQVQAGQHRVQRPAEAFRYDPSPRAHAEALLDAIGRGNEAPSGGAPHPLV